MKQTLDLKTVMNIFDWFNSPNFELIDHILLTKADGEERIRRAMPTFRKEARRLVRHYRNTEIAYPDITKN